MYPETVFFVTVNLNSFKMKNFKTKMSLLPPVVAALAALCQPVFTACDSKIDVPSAMVSPEVPEAGPEAGGEVEMTPYGIASMLASLDFGIEQVKEVWDAAMASSANGYDEEYTFRDVMESPGAGVGDALLRTRAAEGKYLEPLRLYISSFAEDHAPTRASSFQEALKESGLQIYWPSCEDWDGETIPVITFDPGNDSGVSTGFLREQLTNGSWIVRQFTVDEDYAMTHPVWVVNHNDDASYLTPQMVERLGGGAPSKVPATRSATSIKTLKIKEFKAHKQYDPWYSGGSEFFIKCGSIESFTAAVAADLRAYSPEITDFMIKVKRKQVGTFLRFNSILVSEWTPQLDECAFLMVEDDGGPRTTWKASGSVKIKSKAYGFDIEFPMHRNDDIVWRGKLSRNYFEKYNGVPNRFGDTSVAFTID